MKFDLIFILKKLIQISICYQFKNIVFGTSSISSITFTKPNGDTLTIADTFKVFPSSLSKLGKVVNCPKLDFDHNSVNDSSLYNPSFKNLAIEYCKNDCLIVYNVVSFLENSLQSDFNLKLGSSTTSPSIAMKIFKSKFLKYDTNLFNISSDLDSNIRPSYFGGRCEVFKPYLKSQSYYYDVNSLYPYIMSKFPYPFQFVKTLYNVPSYKLSHYYGFAYVTVSVGQCYIPLLPYRLNGKIIYPTGTFNGIYFIPELLNAIKHSPTKILHVHTIYIFKKHFHLFSSYVNHFYKLRQSYIHSNLDAGQQFCKLALNSLYGR